MIESIGYSNGGQVCDKACLQLWKLCKFFLFPGCRRHKCRQKADSGEGRVIKSWRVRLLVVRDLGRGLPAGKPEKDWTSCVRGRRGVGRREGRMEGIWVNWEEW